MKNLGIIAGSGDFPIIVAEGAKRVGVEKIVVAAIIGETDKAIERVADVVVWINLGQLNEMIHCFKANGSESVVMAGQITPTKLFAKLKLDLRMTEIMSQVAFRGAEPLFGKIAEELAKDGLQIIDSTEFVVDQLAEDRVMTTVSPDESEEKDIQKGRELARSIADLDIGQTIIIKDRVVVAVEAIEGTNETIRRAGQLAGPGTIVIKVSKSKQDKRFDMPVVGMETLQVMQESGAKILALDSGGAIMINKQEMLSFCDSNGIVVAGYK